MPRPRGEEHAIASRREAVAAGILRGETYQSMAKRFGVTHPTIVTDVKAIHAAWLASAVGSIGEWKQREVERHRLIIEEAWKAWERSKENSVKTTTGTSGEHVIDTKTDAKQFGDSRYLLVVQKSSDAIAKLLGLYEAEKHEHAFNGPAPGGDALGWLRERISTRN